MITYYVQSSENQSSIFYIQADVGILTCYTLYYRTVHYLIIGNTTKLVDSRLPWPDILPSFVAPKQYRVLYYTMASRSTSPLHIYLARTDDH